MTELLSVFESLGTPAVGDTMRFTAHPIPGCEAHRVAKDSLGRPAILLSVAASDQSTVPVPIILANLSVHHNTQCRVSHSNGSMEYGFYTVVRCVDADPRLHAYFLRVCAPLVLSLGWTPTMLTVSTAIETLVELFTAMTAPPRKSVQGLWAELFVIANSARPRCLVAAWHAAPEDCFDFSLERQRLEVKSSSTRVRQHHFRLEQVCPPSGVDVLIASLFVERAGGGVSFADLYERVRAQVADNAELLLRTDRIVLLTLGETWSGALADRFDWALAKESLAFFDAPSVPKIEGPLPPGVSQVHFLSDMTGVPRADKRHCQAKGGLYEAALPC